MTSQFSAKETAHKIEVLAQDATLNGYDAGAGCTTPQYNLVHELNVLRADPEQLKAVRNQMRWDNWKPNSLPDVKIVDLRNHGLQLQIYGKTNSIDVNTTGRIVDTTDSDPDPRSVSWALRNFNALDRDNNDWLTENEMQNAGSAYDVLKFGVILPAEGSLGLSFGFSPLSGWGNHINSSPYQTLGIDRGRLHNLLRVYSDTKCVSE